MGTDLKRYNDIPGEEHGPAPTAPHDEFGRPLVIDEFKLQEKK